MTRLIALIGLRYRLHWAQVRSHQGRIVLFVAGYLILTIAIVLFALGGIGAAAAAARMGRAGQMAAVVLLALHVNAPLAAVFLGIGVDPAFSEATLRRYPLSGASRMAVRHVTALLEPLWVMVTTLVGGLAIGLAALGAGLGWAVVPVALLFVISTYLVACFIARAVAWLLTRPGGPLVVMLLGLALMMAAPAAIARLARAAAGPTGWVLPAVLASTPPFAAARAMTTASVSSAATGMLVLAGWCLGLSAIVAGVGRLPRRSGASGGGSARWDFAYDGVAAAFGATLAPLAGKLLRYLVRSPQTRYNFPLALPVTGLIISMNAPDGTPGATFLFALGAAPALGILATGTLAMNLFGFDGHGFRRYFLIPTSAGDVLRTAAIVGLIPGALLIPIGLVLWWVFSPEPGSLRMAAMLLCAGTGGLLFFNAVGLWTSLLAPRAIPFDLTFGNRLSPAANGLFIVAMITFFGLPWVLKGIGIDGVLGAWWAAPLFLAAAASMYAATLRLGAATLVRRREQMLSVIEGG